eukprot:PhM_4_TR17366/c0_g1_i1/m.33778/K20305/TRAPPC8, TRS85; trafficking protein particle complex subunit 8
MDIRKFIEERMSPIVVVAASDDTNRTCRKLGVSFIQMLRPFRFLGKDVHIRSVKESDVHQVKNFSIRLFSMENVRGVDDDKLKSYLQICTKDVMAGEGAQAAADGAKHLEDVLRQADPLHPQHASRAVPPTPWFARFQREYVHNARMHHCDTYDHPLGMILAVSTSSQDVVAELKALQPKRPDDFRYCGVDGNWCVLYALVHDAASGISHEGPLKQMCDAFGASNCRLLTINTKDTSKDNSGVWQDTFVRLEDGAEPMPSSGVLFSRSDLTSIATFMENYLTFGLLPFLERRVRNLVQVVSERRQGVMSKMVSWFRNEKGAQGTSQDQVTMPDGTVRFGKDSVEMLCRRLADICFMLRDYEAAGNYYKLLRTDLSSIERAWVRSYLASCLEAYGLCLTLQGKGMITTRSDRDRRAEDNKLEGAFDMYREAGEKTLALRCSLLLTHIYMVKGANDRASELLRRAWTTEVKQVLFIALTVEQAGWCYLSQPALQARGTVSHTRKSALCLTLAGHRYRADQPEHSMRCYKLALDVYQRHGGGTSWYHIWEHVNDSMARLALRKNLPDDGIEHLTRLFEITSPGMRSVEFSERVCREYVTSLTQCTQIKNTGKFKGMPFPLISMKDVAVDCVGKMGLMPSEEGVLARGHLREMEEELRRYVISTHEAYVIHPQSKAVLNDGLIGCDDAAAVQSKNHAVLGETITVHVTVHNPLSVAVELNNVHIIYKNVSGDTATSAAQQEELGEKVEDVHLDPQSSKRLALRLTPTVAGTIRFIGVGLTLFNNVSGVVAFGPAVLECAVGEPMPCMDVCLHPAPTTVFDGQLLRLDLTLTNVSTIPMRRLVIKLSQKNHPILYLCSVGKNGEEAPLALDTENVVCALPKDLVLEPWQSQKLAVYVRASRGGFCGQRNVHNYIAMLLAYSAPGSSTTRLYPIVHKMLVRNSICLDHVVLPGTVQSSSVDAAFLANLRVRNLAKNGDIKLLGISALTVPGWAVSHVTTPGTESEHDSTLTLTLKKTTTEQGDDPKDNEPVKIHSEVVYSPHDADEELSQSKALLAKSFKNGDFTQWPLLPLLIKSSADLGDLSTTPVSEDMELSFYADRGGIRKVDTKVKTDVLALVEPVVLVATWCLEMEGAVFVGVCSTTLVPKTLAMNLPRVGWSSANSLKIPHPTHAMKNDPAITLLDPASQVQALEPEDVAALAAVGCIALSLHYDNEVIHDFSKAAIVELPVKLTLHNRTQRQHSLRVSLKQPSQALPGVGTRTFRWVGKTTHKLTLEPKASRDVELRVCAFAPGAIELKQLGVTVETPTAAATSPSPNLVSVPPPPVQTSSNERWLMHVFSPAYQP